MASSRPDNAGSQPQGGGGLLSRASLLALLADLAKLRRPVTAAAVAATIASILSPFGLDVGPAGAYIVGALGSIGLVAGLIENAGKA
jgi:hypothetical protein